MESANDVFVQIVSKYFLLFVNNNVWAFNCASFNVELLYEVNEKKNSFRWWNGLKGRVVIIYVVQW